MATEFINKTDLILPCALKATVHSHCTHAIMGGGRDADSQATDEHIRVDLDYLALFLDHHPAAHDLHISLHTLALDMLLLGHEA